jgi:hypothetical protein
MSENTRLRVESPLAKVRAEVVAQLREEFQLPVLPLPQGARVPATIVRVQQVDASRQWAVAVGPEAVHLVRVAEDARQLVGKRVELRQDGGIVHAKLQGPHKALQR